MPAAKTKSTTTGGAAPKAKAPKPPSVAVTASQDTSEATPTSASWSGKPDKAAYDAEQEKIKTSIDGLQVKLVRSPLSFFVPTLNF